MLRNKDLTYNHHKEVARLEPEKQWARFDEKKGYYTDPKVYDELEEITGLKRKTLRNIKYVAVNVKMSLRNDNLTFNHHKEVAKLNPDKQKEFETQSMKLINNYADNWTPIIRETLE